MILLIDNYDSFSYNLYQYVGQITKDIKVIRNDEMTLKEIEELAPDHIILSPGPGRPSNAGLCEDIIKEFAGKIPILGVCLGHQAICEVYGGTITYAKELMHGKQCMIKIEKDSAVFKGMPGIIKAARYHSLALDPDTLPDSLRVVSVADDGEIMAVQHNEYSVFGLQFHPESVMTPEGSSIVRNFLKLQ